MSLNFEPIADTVGYYSSPYELIIKGSIVAEAKIRKMLTVVNTSVQQQISILRNKKPYSPAHAEQISEQIRELLPKEITKCYAETDEGLSVPPGNYWMCKTLEGTEHLSDIQPVFFGHERYYQTAAVTEMLKYKRAAAMLITGSGKSLIISVLCRSLAAVGHRVIVIVPSKELLYQTFNPIKEHSGLNVSLLGDGKIPKPGCQVLISTAQSALNYVDAYSAVITDECFVADTIVGTKKICDVKVGDWVPSFDPVTFVVTYEMVIATSSKTFEGELIEVKTKSGEKALCTPNHPFLTDKNKFTPAGELKEGDTVYFALNDVLKKTKIKSINSLKVVKPLILYNLQVVKNQTYIANGIAVHNCQYVPAKTYQDICTMAIRAKHFYALSGSPERPDGTTQLLWNFYGKLVYEYSAQQAIRDGYICPIKYVQYFVPVSDLYKIPKMPIKEYIALHSRDPYIEKVYDLVGQSLDKGRKTLVLFKSNECCKKLADKLGVEAANGDYRAPFYAFKRGDTNLLIANISLLGVGIDVPDISAIIYCAGSQSEISVVQAFGRAVRIKPGKKDAVIADVIPYDLIHQTTRDKWKNKGNFRKYIASRYKEISTPTEQL